LAKLNFTINAPENGDVNSRFAIVNIIKLDNNAIDIKIVFSLPALYENSNFDFK
jgi:hypothetical protein